MLEDAYPIKRCAGLESSGPKWTWLVEKVDGEAMFTVALLWALAVVRRLALLSSRTEKVGGRLRMAPPFSERKLSKEGNNFHKI